MQQDLIASLGEELHRALVARAPVAPLSSRGHGLTIEHAYRIQQRFLAHRLAAGDRIVGKKIGVTSKPVQDFLGVFEPDFGQLTSSMVRSESEIGRASCRERV